MKKLSDLVNTFLHRNIVDGILVARKYVFVVLECSHILDVDTYVDEKIHGVYINREEAEGKRHKMLEKHKGTEGWIAVLKLPLQGKSLW